MCRLSILTIDKVNPGLNREAGVWTWGKKSLVIPREDSTQRSHLPGVAGAAVTPFALLSWGFIEAPCLRLKKWFSYGPLPSGDQLAES